MIRARIVTEARKLLLYSDLTAAGVGEKLGFDDPAYFARFFRRETGTAPARFPLDVAPLRCDLTPQMTNACPPSRGPQQGCLSPTPPVTNPVLGGHGRLKLLTHPGDSTAADPAIYRDLGAGHE